VNNFWRRLREGYKHDASISSDATLTFDSRRNVYLKDGRIVVPDFDRLRYQIMLWHHVHPWCAHMGQNHTAELLTRGFYWPNMHSEISEFVRTCHNCQINKSSGLRDALLSPIAIPHACWHVVGVDAITQLPRTTSGKDCVFVLLITFPRQFDLARPNVPFTLLDSHASL
jgi:hypothetical protein